MDDFTEQPANRKPASFLQGLTILESKDPASDVPGMPRNFGQYTAAHTATFQSFYSSGARVYREYDEAIRDNLNNARYMRNDCGIMECLEARQRMAALLDWHLEPENEKSHEQKELCEQLTKIISRIHRFTEYRRVLQEAIWYGKAAIQHRFGWVNVCGAQRQMPKPWTQDDPGWKPINGDKLVYRQDRDDLPAGAYAGQLGIRVGAGFYSGQQIGGGRWQIEPTDRGMAYFLRPFERETLCVHRHMIEDAAFEDGISSGALFGVGIRSRIYWEWVQKQESLGFLMEYLERSAGGIEIWTYPSGNDVARAEMENAAKNRARGQNVLIVPQPMGDEGQQYGVQVIEPGLGGIESVKDLVENYFGHRVKRYILGQVLSSEAAATGLGSGVADLHLDTLMQIIRYDATNLEETLTYQLVQFLQRLNFPKSIGTLIRFKIDVETPDVEKKLQAWQTAYEMGCRIKESDVMNLIGASVPGPKDRVLVKQEPQQLQPGAPGQIGGSSGSPGVTSPDHLAGAFNQEFHRQAEEHAPDDDRDDDGGPDRYSREPDGDSPLDGGISSEIFRAACETNTSPSEAQKQSGNYQKGKFRWNGLQIAIENPAGSTRSGKDKDGKPWSIVMPVHYGYILRHESEADGDHVDIFMGPNPESDLVCVVDQRRPSNHFDEHKVMAGFVSVADAEQAYLDSYSDGWDGLESIVPMTVPQFLAWLEDGDTGERIADQVSRYSRTGFDPGDHPRNPDNGQFIGDDEDEIDDSSDSDDDLPQPPKVSSRGNMDFEDAKSSLLAHKDGVVLFQSAVKNGEIAGKMTDDAQRQSLTKIVNLMLANVDSKTKLAYRSVMRHFEGHKLDDLIADEDPDLVDELQADGTEKYAKKHKPAKGQKGLEWVTIGGGEEGDKKHVGGTPVQIDGSGNIHSGPDALRGKNLDKLKSTDKDTTKDTPRGETYVRGDRAEYTGNVSPEGLHEVEIMEGHRKGEMALVSSPEQQQERAKQKQAEWQDQQAQFSNLHKVTQKQNDEKAKNPLVSQLDSEFSLARQSATGRKHFETENNDANKQGALFIGKNDKPGQNYLFGNVQSSRETAGNSLMNRPPEGGWTAADEVPANMQSPKDARKTLAEKTNVKSDGESRLSADATPQVSDDEFTSILRSKLAAIEGNGDQSRVPLSLLGKSLNESLLRSKLDPASSKKHHDSLNSRLSWATDEEVEQAHSDKNLPSDIKSLVAQERAERLIQARQAGIEPPAKTYDSESAPAPLADGAKNRRRKILQARAERGEELPASLLKEFEGEDWTKPKEAASQEEQQPTEESSAESTAAGSSPPQEPPQPPDSSASSGGSRRQPPAKTIPQKQPSSIKKWNYESAKAKIKSKFVPRPPKEGEEILDLRRPQNGPYEFIEFKAGDLITGWDNASESNIHYVVTSAKPGYSLKSEGYTLHKQLVTARPATDSDHSAVKPQRTSQAAETKSVIDRAMDYPKENYSRRLAADFQTAIDRYYRSPGPDARPEHPDDHGVTFAEAQSHSPPASPSAPPSASHPPAKNKPGWQHVGGSSVFVNADGKITKGCPGLKGEHVSDLIDESDESRDERDARQAHAKARGLTGKDLTGTEAKKLGSKRLQAQHQAAKEAGKVSGVGTHHVLRNLPEAQERLASTSDPLEPARARARQLTGQNSATLGMVENRGGGDSNSVANMDVIGQQLAEEFPELGWDMSDDNSAKVFDLIRQGKSADRLAPHSPEVAGHAAELAKQEKATARNEKTAARKSREPLSNPIAETMQQAFDEWNYRSYEPAGAAESATQPELEESVPF